MKSAASLPALSPVAPSSSAASASSPLQTLTNQLVDDIPAEEWLAEVDSTQYLDCFVKNFPSPDAKNRKRGIISRKRLETLRLQDYPKLNIKDFEEAKKLNEHVKTVLKYEFDSPHRKSEVNVLRQKLGITPAGEQLSSILPPLSPSPMGKSESAPMFVTEHSLVSPNQDEGIIKPTTPSRQRLSYIGSGDVVSSFMHKTHSPLAPQFVVAAVEQHGNMSEKKVKVTSDKKRRIRRRSFDNEVWKHINTLRTNAEKSTDAAQHLREGFFPDKKDSTTKKKGTRRWSMENKNASIPKDPSKMHYGAMAAHYNMLQHQMTLVQEHILSKIKKALKCGTATFQFYDCGASTHSAKMILYHNDIWYTMSMDAFAGHVVKSQEMIISEDAQSDPRLDRSFEEIMGVQIRNLIAQPVWCQDGSMVGVIELANRMGEFELEDPEKIILNTMSEELAHDLHIKYRDLMSVSHLLDVNSHKHKAATLHNPSKINTSGSIRFAPTTHVAKSSAEARADREDESNFIASSSS